MRAVSIVVLQRCPISKFTGWTATSAHSCSTPHPRQRQAEKVLGLADELAADGIHLSHLDFGGGMGIRYSDETVPTATEYLAQILKLTAGRKEKLLFEPGRSLVGNAGLLLTKVEVLKPGSEKNFAIIDAAMNDLMRPALYDAYHDIVPVVERAQATANAGKWSGPFANPATSSVMRVIFPLQLATCLPSCRLAPMA